MIASPRRYDSTGRGPPMRYASSACSTCSACASIDEWTATVRIARRRQVRITRQAISPRLAIRILSNMRAGAFPLFARGEVGRHFRLGSHRNPRGAALLEEGGDALAALGRRADLRNA